MDLPLVSIIGRPNVGKSSLFNRIAKARVAVVADEAGTTRDRLIREVETTESRFLLVDTGGLEFDDAGNTIEEDTQAQSRIAIADADLILFLIDSTEPLTKRDFDAVDLLRKSGKSASIVFCASKAENPLRDEQVGELLRLGFGEPIEISAMHGRGIETLLHKTEHALRDLGYKKAKLEHLETDTRVKIALVGKPNAGKSSMINAFLSEERLIVSDIPGTTRDSIDSVVRFSGEDFVLIDTAGIRRRGKIESGIEKFSVMRTLQSLKRADTAVLVIDGSEPVSAQDQHIAEAILEAGCGVLIAVNKWDEAEKGEEARDAFLLELQRRFPFLSWAPVVFVSAKTRKNLIKIFPLAREISEERKKRVSTAKLNAFLRELDAMKKPTGTKIVRPKILFATMASVAPPEIVLFINQKSAFHFSYWRFFENRFREAFGFAGTPIRLVLRERAPKKVRDKAVKEFRREASKPKKERSKSASAKPKKMAIDSKSAKPTDFSKARTLKRPKKR